MSTMSQSQNAEAKHAILTRIRSALTDRPATPEIPRRYRRHSELTSEQKVEMLVDRLIDYKASVHRETSASLPDRLRELLGQGRVLVPHGLDPDWLPEDMNVVQDVGDFRGGLSARELDQVDAVVTSSTVSCAETGTIFLNSAPAEGRRSLSLVPDHHVCLVPLETVVELIPEAFERVSSTAPITMISGPSATSDIELQRVEGVHGPRRLDVILLDRG